MNYSFDYDNTLIKYKYTYNPAGEIADVNYDEPHYENIKILCELHQAGHTIFIVTSRMQPEYEGFKYDWDDSPPPEQLIKEMELPVKEVVYTSGKKKLNKLLLYDIKKHWDDDEKEIEEIKNYNELSYPKFINESIEYVLVTKPEGITERLREKFIRMTSYEDYGK